MAAVPAVCGAADRDLVRDRRVPSTAGQLLGEHTLVDPGQDAPTASHITSANLATRDRMAGRRDRHREGRAQAVGLPRARTGGEGAFVKNRIRFLEFCRNLRNLAPSEIRPSATAISRVMTH